MSQNIKYLDLVNIWARDECSVVKLFTFFMGYFGPFIFLTLSKDFDRY